MQGLVNYKNLKYFSRNLSIMEKLKISNSCVNCENLDITLKTCGIHNVEVSEKYTCDEFEKTI